METLATQPHRSLILVPGSDGQSNLTRNRALQATGLVVDFRVVWFRLLYLEGHQSFRGSIRRLVMVVPLLVGLLGRPVIRHPLRLDI